MSAFSSPRHAASWAGLCPGNHESGGKRLSNRTRKGNRWLRRALCQAAWAATRKKNSYIAAFFYRKAGKHGIRKAIVATAHRLLIIAFCMEPVGQLRGKIRESGAALDWLRGKDLNLRPLGYERAGHWLCSS